ncbi:MAG: hypothetical protein GXY32_03400 [Ruminococcaceae bacterium]|nr:hypothetical protein [Oscillospiraceae bacterium]
MKCKNCGFDYGDQKFCPMCKPVQPLSVVGLEDLNDPFEPEELPPDVPTILKGEEQ